MNFEFFMKRAIQIARKAEFQTDPNPMVGSVLVDAQGNILSEGYHKKAGTPHAEVNTLAEFEEVPADSTLFVTLEPCSHYGKTPPCCELVVQKKVKRIVIGCTDPNPVVAGNGIRFLEENGVEVISGVLEKECYEMNAVFNKHILTGLPFVSGKAGISLDGKIAMASGESQWITGNEAREFGHELRSQHQAIVVGANTLLKDNPRLNNRQDSEQSQPIRVVFSSLADIPEQSHFFQADDTERILFVGNQADDKKIQELEKAGIHVFVGEEKKPRVRWALDKLYQEKNICSLLVEGGGELLASFIQDNLVDQLYLFVSGKIIGEKNAPSWCGDLGISSLSDVPHLSFQNFQKLGNDLLLIAQFNNSL
ncbi:MAG: diaminohydroxyphosphoribosylaminopyrimidine deaminase [bacterium]